MNILLTSVGRMVYLVSYFKEVIGNGGNVIVATGVENPAAKKVADKTFLVPYFYEANYIASIVDICVNEKIDYLFSLHDLEGPILARNIDKLKGLGVNPIVSDLHVIETCLDKYKAFQFLILNKINTPYTWLSPEEFRYDNKNTFPVILKPRFGYGSINHLLANNREELFFCFKYLEARKNKAMLSYLGVDPKESSTVIQEVLEGEEFGIEIINNIKKELVIQYHKRKLGMRAGETEGSQIIVDTRLEGIGKTLSDKLGHIGLLDCDVFFKGDIPYVLDMNPRFGGQYPFTHSAGANIPELIISDFKIPVKKIKVGDTFIKIGSVVNINNKV